MATVRFQEWLQQSTAEVQEWAIRWPSSEACDTINPKTGLPYFSLSIPRCTSRSAVIRIALEGKRTLLNVPVDFDDFDRLLEEAVASYIIAQRPAQKRDVEYWRGEFGKVYYWRSHPVINNRENGNNRKRNIINVADGPGSFPALEEWEQASSLTVSHMLLALLFCYNRFPIGIPLCALPSCATVIVTFAFTPLAPELRKTINGWDGEFGAFSVPPPITTTTSFCFGARKGSKGSANTSWWSGTQCSSCDTRETEEETQTSTSRRSSQECFSQSHPSWFVRRLCLHNGG